MRDEFKPNIPEKKVEIEVVKEEQKKEIPIVEQPKPEIKVEEKEYSPKEEIKLIGEAFNTYIVAQKGDSVFMIDKHAAHERILFNKLKENNVIESQALLIPMTVKLVGDEYSAMVNNIDLLTDYGFEIEDFGNENVMVRAIPAMLEKQDAESIVVEAAQSLAQKGTVDVDRIDDILHTVACKAAIKAGYITSDVEKLNLAIKILSDNDVMYCPHGRPVAFEIKKYNLEKYFGRIQ